MAPTYFRRNVENIAAVAKSRGIGVVLVTWPYSEEVKDYVSLPHYQKGVAELNAVMREGKYRPEVWKELTGKTVEELAREWQVSLAGAGP